MSTLRYLLEQLDKEIKPLQDTILAGLCTHDEYMKICARVQGLTDVQEMIQDLIKKQESLDD